MSARTPHQLSRPALRGQANRHDVLRRLIAATERLLARGHAFSEISIGALAREAGIARSTFYQHYRDRQALLREMTTVLVADTQDACDPLLELGAHTTFNDLQTVMRAIIDILGQHELLMRPILAATTQDSLIHAAYQQAVTRVVVALEGLIRRLGPGGTAPDCHPRAMATVLVRMVERSATEEATTPNTIEQRELIANALAHVVWRTIFTNSRA